jgi:Fe-S cluster biogenesis protein NfuA
MRKRIEEVLSLIRPSVQADGGDVELVDVLEDGVVRVRFRGECIRCPSSSQTLQHGIERNLKRYIPQVKAVESIS